MKPLEFVIDVAPTTFWKIRIFVWTNLEAMRRSKRRYGKDHRNPTTQCSAYCYSRSMRGAAEDGECIGDIHLNRKDLKLVHIVHECYHALYTYSAMMKINERGVAGEEMSAEAIEHMVGGIVAFLLKKRVPIKMPKCE